MKVLKAMHKVTGQIVSATKLEYDPSWIGKEREEWISPYHEIHNWNELKEKGFSEVKVSFVKTHKRNEELVRCHFRIDNEHAIPNPENESESHRISKEGIYESIWNNEIFVNGKKIRELFNIEDVDLEFRLSSSRNSKIADVIAIFKEPHELYGRGIVFEIQFSNQNEEKTEERSFDRILEGYSVVWLWKGMFNENNKLIKKEVEVIPFVKALKEYKEKIEENFSNNINKLSQALDYKLYKIKREIKEEGDYYKKDIKDEANNLENMQKIYRDKIEEKIRLISTEEKGEIKKQLTNQYQEFITNLSNSKEIIKGLDYDKIIDGMTSKEIDLIRMKIEERLEKEITKSVHSKMDNLIIPDILDKILPKIENTYKQIGSFEIIGKCYKCNHKFLIKSMDFEGGQTFCEPCFNELPDNWRKRWFKQEEYRKLEDEISKLKKEKGVDGLDNFN